MRSPRLLWLVGLALIITLNLAGSLYWIDHNIVLVGRDSAGHLERTAVAFHAPSFFAALTLTDDYRPPLLYLASVPFYQLFGVDMDSAQYLNVVLLAAILVLTFTLARRFLSIDGALFAALLTGLLPMITAMSRLFYMENLLTTLLLVNLLALLACEGFAQRRPSLIWGLSLGLLLLTKWTAPIYIVLPTLFVLWQAVRMQPQVSVGRLSLAAALPWATSGKLLDWRRAIVALALALLLVALWWWPNRQAMDEFLLGNWIPLLWVALFALCIYVLSLPASRTNNFLGAIFLALSLASLWYLPHIDFTKRLTDVAFGTDRGTQEALDLTRWSNYTRYFGFWLTHHMGLLATLVILPPALWGWIKKDREIGRQGEGERRNPKSKILWLTLLSGYLFLALIAQANARNLNPLLPVVAILLAGSLTSYPRPLAIGLGLVWVVVLGLQWSIYTFDGLAKFYERAPRLWVGGDYMAWPATGSSDPGYWIQPDVLATIGNPEGEAASFGVLIDSWEIHRGSFRYLIAAQQLNVELMALTESDSRGWSDLIANQWVLLKKGDNRTVKEPGQQVLARIRAGDPLFSLLYQEAKRYPLPNGETAILYHRSQGPALPYDYPVVLIETAALADAINRYWSEDATLYFSNADTATWVGIHDLKADRILMPGAEAENAQMLLPDVTGTILAATRYDTGEVQSWLHATSYPALEVGDGEFHLTVVGRPQTSLSPLPVQSEWNEVRITELWSLPTLRPGAVLPVEIHTAGRVDGSLKLSLRLVDPTGAVVAQQDKTVEPEFRLGLLLSPDAPPGSYTLAGVLYDPQTLAPLPGLQGDELVSLIVFQVE